MNKHGQTIRVLLLAVVCGMSFLVAAQESSSLGDVARKARKEHSSAQQATGKRISEDDDGPDLGGVWRVRHCSPQVCYKLSVALPKSPRWIRQETEPRPVLIPLAGHEEDLNHAIRVYAVEFLPTTIGWIDVEKKALLQSVFAQPEYFGQPARLVQDERVPANNGEMKISHFSINSAKGNFRGASVVASSPLGPYAFACVFREEDASAASSICDAIAKSARDQSFLTSQTRQYPTYEDPPNYDPQDDPPDPPANEDPE